MSRPGAVLLTQYDPAVRFWGASRCTVQLTWGVPVTMPFEAVVHRRYGQSPDTRRDDEVPDGLVGPGNFGVNLLAPAAGIVEAFIGTEPADVEYAGVAPALVSAAQQINVLIPVDSQTGPAVPVRIGMLNTYSTAVSWVWTQDGVTIAIQ